MSYDTQEHKQVDDTTSQSAPTGETNEADSMLDSDQSKNVESADGSSTVDYKAEYEAALAAKEKAEKALVREKTRHKEKTTTKTVDLPGDNAPSVDVDEIISRVNQEVEQRVSALTTSLLQDKISSSVSSITSNADEQKLTLFHYQNSIKHTGYDAESIKNDLIAANAIANRAKLAKQNEELKEALASRATTPTAPAFSGQKIQRGQSKQMNSATKAVAEGLDRFIKKHAKQA